MLRREDQRGFTLVELSVAMTLMLLVSGALLAALESGTTAERHASTRIDDEQSVRVVLAQFTHDVRNASSLPWIAPGTSDHQVDLEVAGQHIRWWYDAAGHILHRQIDSGGGAYSAGIADRTWTICACPSSPGARPASGAA